MDTTRQSKVARLPAFIREQVNLRLHDGQAGSELLPWLNGLPEVKRIVEAQFEGIAISEANLSNWRKSGYADWLRRREHGDNIKDLANHCRDIAQEGGDVLQGSAAIAGGLLMQVIEALDPEIQRQLISEKPEKLVPLLSTLSSLMASNTAHKRAQIADQRTQLAERRTEQNAERLRLDRERFEVVVCEKLMDWADRPEVRKVLASADQKREAKIAQLRLAIFGDHVGEAAEV